MTTFADKALDIAAAVADRLATPELGYERARDQWWPQSLAQGAAGISLLHIERARTGHASWEAAHRWLKAAVRDGVASGPEAHLYFGAPAVLLALHHAHEGTGGYEAEIAQLDGVLHRIAARRLAAAHERADQGKLPELSEFDAIRGLTGLGLLLELRDPGSERAREVLEYLVRLTEPLEQPDGRRLPGWWTAQGPDGTTSPRFPGGHSNHGIAHGIAGPLALLSLAHLAGTRVPGHVEAMARIVAWLDTWMQTSDEGTWWPYWVTTAQHHEHELVVGPQRPSWCYGAGGLGRAQQLAAEALADDERSVAARDALTEALGNPTQLRRVRDASICHGWSGHTLLAHTSGIGAPLDLLSPLCSSATVEEAADLLLTPHDGRSGIGFLEGGAGAATVLHTLGAGTNSTWFSFLLIGDRRA